MTTLLVARHGEADWNRERRWLGHADRPLTDLGRTQAEALARQLDGIAMEAAYASDLSRAMDTARTAVGNRGIAVTPLRELRERDYGAWDGVHDDDIPRRFPHDHAEWTRGAVDGAPDAESYAALAERVVRALHRIAAAHPQGTVLVVAHGEPLRVFQALALDIDYTKHRRAIPTPPHATLVRYVMADGRLRAVSGEAPR